MSSGEINGPSPDYFLEHFAAAHSDPLPLRKDSLDLITYLQLKALRGSRSAELYEKLGCLYEAKNMVTLCLCCFLMAYQFSSEKSQRLLEKIYKFTQKYERQKYITGIKYEEYSSLAVSVIMRTYDRLEAIRESVESVLRQSFSDFELIIINDGGKLETEEIAKSYESPKIRYFRLKHRGRSGAMNEGLRRARGTYIAYLDDDDIYYPNHLQTLVSALERSGGDFAYSNAWRISGLLQNGHFVGHSRKLPDHRPNDFSLETLSRYNYISTLNVVHKRECLEVVGGMNEDLNVLEDWDLWLRMSQKYGFQALGEITGEYRYTNNNVSRLNHLELLFTEVLLSNFYRSFNGYNETYKFCIANGLRNGARSSLDCIGEVLLCGFPISKEQSDKIAIPYMLALRHGIFRARDIRSFLRAMMVSLQTKLNKIRSNLRRIMDRYIIWRFKAL